MTPAELIETALREHLRIHPQERATATLKRGEPIPLSGGEAAYASQIVEHAFAGAGLVVVPAEDVIAALASPGGLTEPGSFAAHVLARDALLTAAREALAERRTPDA